MELMNTEGSQIYGDNLTVTGNQAVNNAGYGFYLGGDMTFTGNTASNNGGDGVYFYSSGSYINVSSNTIKSNNGEGLANDEGSGVVIVTNNIVTGNRLDICDDAVLLSGAPLAEILGAAVAKPLIVIYRLLIKRIF